MGIEQDWFIHPLRAKENAPGPFYAVTVGSDCGCGIPEEIAPSLLANAGPPSYQTYFKKQPGTKQEVLLACEVLEACGIHDLRYGGKDPEIIQRLKPDRCDYICAITGKVVLGLEAEQLVQTYR